MNQLEAFRILDKQITDDIRDYCRRFGREPGDLMQAHRVLQKVILKRARQAVKRDREERLMKGEL